MKKLYDFDKENDKEFLREAGKMLQLKVIDLEVKLAQALLKNLIDHEIKSTLTDDLLVLRKRLFDSKQEKKEKIKKLKKDKKNKKINLVHNQNENKSELDKFNGQNINLETKEIEHDLDCKTCPYCSKESLDEIKNLFDESSEFDVNQTYYILKRHKRKKYKCSQCDKITTAKGPDKLIPGGQFSAQMAVQVVCDKFEYHLPLERQRVKMEKLGLILSVKTLFSLTAHLYNIIFDLNEMNRKDIIEDKYVCIDESPMPFYNDSKSIGYVWSLSNSRGAYYQFEPTRSGKVAMEMIKGFYGVVMTDGYSGYNFLSETDGIIHAYCWAHLRRYFFDAMTNDEKVGEVIDYIDELFEVEHLATGFDDLKILRSNKSTVIFQKIDDWIRDNESSYLTSTLSGKAIKYYLNQREGLMHFLKNVHVPLSNNMAESKQRCPVMGRKNFQAFRSINGADVGMFFYSMIESCKMNGLSPAEYLLKMTINKLKNEKIQTPYQYASQLKNEIEIKLRRELLDGICKDSS